MEVNHVLSIDVEDWFQVENYAQVISRDQWPHCGLRVADNVHRLLDLLAAGDVRATFFVLGWVADRLPNLVRDIAQAGHEVASHGWSHTPVWSLSESEFFDEVSRSRTLLEELGGQPVIGYRAPTFSVTRLTLWALRELHRAGYRYDSSIFPVMRQVARDLAPLRPSLPPRARRSWCRSRADGIVRVGAHRLAPHREPRLLAGSRDRAAASSRRASRVT